MSGIRVEIESIDVELGISETFTTNLEITEINASFSDAIVIRSDGSSTESIEILSPLQTVWTISGIPKSPGLSKLFINGQKQRYAIDYQINGAIVTWMGYSLKPDWMIELYYI